MDWWYTCPQYGIDFAAWKEKIHSALHVLWQDFMETMEDRLSMTCFWKPEDSIQENSVQPRPDKKIVVYCFKWPRYSNTYILDKAFILVASGWPSWSCISTLAQYTFGTTTSSSPKQKAILGWQLVLSLKDHRPVVAVKATTRPPFLNKLQDVRQLRFTVCRFMDLISCNRRGIEMIHKEEPTQAEFLLLEWSQVTEDGSTHWRWHVQWYSWTSAHIWGDACAEVGLWPLRRLSRGLWSLTKVKPRPNR